MEFVPICLECDNLKKIDKCDYYKEIPHEIKNREIKCPYFTGDEYILYSKEAYPGSGD